MANGVLLAPSKSGAVDRQQSNLTLSGPRPNTGAVIHEPEHRESDNCDLKSRDSRREFTLHKPGLVTVLPGLLMVAVIFGSIVYGGEGYPDNPLIDAAWRDNLKLVRKLLDEGADVNSKTDSGETALMMALSPDRIQMAKLLLSRGIDVNAGTTRGKTALFQAAANGNTKLVRLLLDKGADVHAKTEWGLTALAIAQKNGYKDVVGLLKRHGAKE